MKTNRGVGSAVQRALAVLVCSVMTLSTAAPAMAAIERSNPAPMLSNTRMPALPENLAAPQIETVGQIKSEMLGSVSPAALARPGYEPAASANIATPAARAFASVLADVAAGGAAGIESAGFSRDLSAAKDGQDALYDRARGVGAQAPMAIEGEDWTTAPAVLPMATLRPLWHAAQAASAPELKQRARVAPIDDPIKETEVAVTEKLVAEEAQFALKDLTDADASYGRQERFEAAGARQAVLLPDAMAWIDGEGRVAVYYRSMRKVSTFKVPGGTRAEKLAVSQDGSYLYVLAGDSLQRWALKDYDALVVKDPKVLGQGIVELNAVRAIDGKAQGLDARTPSGHLYWQDGSLGAAPSGSEEIEAAVGAAPVLRSVGDGFYLESRPGATRLWGRQLGDNESAVVDLGSVPTELRAITVLPDGKTAFAVTRGGLIEWDLQRRRYREFPVAGLSEAVTGPTSLDVSADGRRALISVDGKLFSIDLGAAPKDIDSEEAEVRRWAEENPMYIKGNLLYIGEFTFPVRAVYEKLAPETWWQRLWRGLLGRPAPVARRIPPVSADQWQALNLPSNKWALYQTLKAFTLGQNTLYIGETGGGKTWMASMIGKLIGRKLYTVSFTEYTKNQDLLFSRTFGEEAAGKTGKTLETVLQWLNDPEGGILLLDEMHKPLEGIAALNNILQNLTYHMGGRDIVGSRSTHFVIGTMNPVKPPYKGEPPSGELSSRFGTTIQVNYLPPSEEAALLSIFFPAIDAGLSRTLVSIARDLRKVYPEVLPLPISSRTLLYVAEHIAKYPDDDRVKIFKSTYNPGTIVEDPSIIEAIEKALKAHDLSRDGSKKKA